MPVVSNDSVGWNVASLNRVAQSRQPNAPGTRGLENRWAVCVHDTRVVGCFLRHTMNVVLATGRKRVAPTQLTRTLR